MTTEAADADDPALRRLTTVVLWGVAFAAATLACATLIVRDSVGKGWHAIPYAAAVAAFLLGAVGRLLLAGPRGPLTGRRGAVMGGLIALLAHPLTWALAGLHQTLFGGPSPVGDTPLGVTGILWGSPVFAFWSLLLTGWWTVPAGAGLGAVLARIEHRLLMPPGRAPAMAAAGHSGHGANPMIVIGILFGVGAALLLIGAFVYPPLYEMPAAFDLTTFGAILAALLAIHAFLLGGQDRFLVKLVLMCFFLIPTTLALSVGGVMTLNGLLDPGNPSEHVARVVDAYRVRSTTGPGRPYRRLQVESWRAGEPDPWLDVDPHLYDSVIRGKSAIRVETKPGRLGIEWIVALHAAPARPGGKPSLSR
jgi:hypothetical protein